MFLKIVGIIFAIALFSVITGIPFDFFIHYLSFKKRMLVLVILLLVFCGSLAILSDMK
jgi:hypothetical protein